MREMMSKELNRLEKMSKELNRLEKMKEWWVKN